MAGTNTCFLLHFVYQATALTCCFSAQLSLSPPTTPTIASKADTTAQSLCHFNQCRNCIDDQTHACIYYPSLILGFHIKQANRNYCHAVLGTDGHIRFIDVVEGKLCCAIEPASQKQACAKLAIDNHGNYAALITQEGEVCHISMPAFDAVNSKF